MLQQKYGKQSFNQIKLKEMILWYNGQEVCTRGVISTKEKISWDSGQKYFSNIEKKTKYTRSNVKQRNWNSY